PALVRRKLGVEKIEAIKRMTGIVDSSVHVHAASLACVALDRSVRVDDRKLVPVGGDLDVFPRGDRDLRKESAARLPTFGAAADVVVGALTRDRNRNLVRCTLAIERAAREIR